MTDDPPGGDAGTRADGVGAVEAESERGDRGAGGGGGGEESAAADLPEEVRELSGPVESERVPCYLLNHDDASDDPAPGEYNIHDRYRHLLNRWEVEHFGEFGANREYPVRAADEAAFRIGFADPDAVVERMFEHRDLIEAEYDSLGDAPYSRKPMYLGETVRSLRLKQFEAGLNSRPEVARADFNQREFKSAIVAVALDDPDLFYAAVQYIGERME